MEDQDHLEPIALQIVFETLSQFGMLQWTAFTE